MSKILVTGTTGFIGSRLWTALGSGVGFDQLVSFSSRPPQFGAYLNHQHYQIGEGFFESQGFNEIEIVVHAGAFTPKSGAEANDVVGCQQNIEYTFRLLQALPPSVKQVVFLSTLDVYGNTSEPITESSAIQPVSLYGHSKWYGERMVESWTTQNKVNCCILRIGHTYGPGEEAYKKIIPVSINRLLQGQSPQIWGTGNALRSFIFIDDVVRAIIQATQLQTNVGPINVVSKNAFSMTELVGQLIRISGLAVQPEYISTNVPEKDMVFVNTKMEQWLTSEQTTLEAGLTAEWNYMQQLR